MFFANGKVAISEGQELLFIEKQIPLVISRPFKFLGHGQRIDRTGLHAYAAEQTASHVHVIFFGISFNRSPRTSSLMTALAHPSIYFRDGFNATYLFPYEQIDSLLVVYMMVT